MSQDACVCSVCETRSESVLDGICELCEPAWLFQLGVLSKQLDEDTRLVSLFQQATIAAKAMVLNKTNDKSS